MPGDLSEALSAACGSHAAQLAIVGDASNLHYAELAESAASLCRALITAGIEPDEPVHVLVSNQPLDIAAIFGVWLAGGVAVPVHRKTPSAVNEAFARRTRARWLVDLDVGRLGATALTAIASEPPPRRALLQGAALIIFTSGSTGVPKGVVVAHDAFRGKIRQIDSLLHFNQDDRTLLVLNITFSFGLWVSLLTLLNGGTLVMRSRFEPASFLRTLIEQRVTRVGMVPTMMRVLFSDARHEHEITCVTEAAQLRQIWIGGEALGASLGRMIRDRFAVTDLVDIYGSTETATCDFFAFPADYALHPGSIGRPAPGVEFRIAADDELQIRSPYLMKGYLDEPELTAAAFCDGWFRTGDLGRVVEGDRVELMGRQKELISRAGNKVTPAEIEQALCAHPDVSAAMAVGIADPVLGERIHVLLIARAGTALAIDEVRRHLEPRLERYKCPDAYYLGEALPLGRTGKADRSQFKALVTSGTITPVSE